MWEYYAKIIVAILGAGVTSALTFWGPSTTVGHFLIVGSTMLTAAGVYFAPYEKPEGEKDAVRNP